MGARTLSPRGTAWVDTLCALMGLVILFVALGIIPTDESKLHAPHWVVGAAGLVFFLAGLAILTGPPPGAPEAARTTWRTFLLGLGIALVWNSLHANDGRTGVPCTVLVRKALQGAANREEVFRDLFWALLNSKEFSFNH